MRRSAKFTSRKSKIKNKSQFWVLKLNIKTVLIGFLIDFATVFLFWFGWLAVIILQPQYKLDEIDKKYYEIKEEILKESNAKEFKKSNGNGEENKNDLPKSQKENQ